MLGLLINLIIIALVLGLIYWLLTLLPLKDPFPLIIRVVFIIIAVLVLIDLLLSLTGSGGRLMLWRY